MYDFTKVSQERTDEDDYKKIWSSSSNSGVLSKTVFAVKIHNGLAQISQFRVMV
jgi:hypothetical protein